mgnify:CR=1 FL=1
MNNEIYLRLCSLMERLGFSAEGKGITRGEMAGYAEGISFADEMLSQTLNEIFISTMSGFGIERFCDLLSIERKATDEETKQAIIEKAAQSSHQISVNEYNNAMAKMDFYSETKTGDGIAYKISPVTKENLAALGEFIENYFPVYRKAVYDGNGSDWNSLELLNFYWYEIDASGFSFDIFESIEA